MRALWTVVVFVMFLGLFSVAAGLLGTKREARTFGASDVLTGCITVVVAGFAAYALWGMR